MNFEDLPRTTKFKAGDTVRFFNGSGQHWFVISDVLLSNGTLNLVAVGGGAARARPEVLELVPQFKSGFYRVWDDGHVGNRHTTYAHAANAQSPPFSKLVGVLEMHEDGTTTMHTVTT